MISYFPNPHLDFLVVMSTHKQLTFMEENQEKTSKKSYAKNEPSSNISHFFFPNGQKQNKKKLCKQDTKGALSLFEGF